MTTNYLMKQFSTLYRLLFVSLFCCFALVLKAEVFTGNCGETLYWSFDTETGHLEITGSGKMNLTKYPAWNKKNLTISSVTFPDSITSIDSYAFEEQEITELVIPASVEKFGLGAFINMQSLQRFTYERIGYADSEYGILRNCRNLRYFQGISRMLSYNDNIDTIIVTYGAAINSWFGPTYIDNTHAYDTRLTGKYDETPKAIRTYLFPSELEVIGNFYLCNAPELAGITIPMNVRSIGRGAFMNCTSLDSLVFLGDTIETIADSAFYNCANLAYIRLQDTIPPTIYETTFYNVDRSIPVYIPQNSKDRYLQAPYWSEFTNYIEPWAYDFQVDSICYNITSDTTVEVTSSVASPWNGTNYPNLTIANIPCTVTYNDTTYNVISVGDSAFAYCPSLTSITIPNSVTIIGDSAFINCSGLTSVTCEATMPPVLGSNAFDNVSTSIPVYVPCGAISDYQSAEGWSHFTNFQCLNDTELDVEDIIFDSPKSSIQKLLRNGQLLIIRAGKTYNTLGVPLNTK